MKYFGENAFSHLAQLIKSYFAQKEHTHTTEDITDYTEYELPTASSDTLGGIKVGAGLSMNEGVLSANGGGTADSVDWSNVQNKPTTVSGYGITDASISGQVVTIGDNTLTVPTNNTELTNGAGYQTASDVESAIESKISSVMTYKGTVANYSDLPADAEIGDVYNITNSSDYNEAGDNACWNGTEWDVLSGLIDLSNYLETSSVSEITNTEIDEIWNG